VKPPLKILFICTHNRCRSILSEAITHARADGRVVAASAGSRPAGEVHPATLAFLREAGYAVAGLRSKSWNEVKAFEPDVVVTVCDAAAQEPCPVWFGKSVQVHWGLPDPSKAPQPDQPTAFRLTIAEIERRTDQLLALPFEQMRENALASELARIAETSA